MGENIYESYLIRIKYLEYLWISFNPIKDKNKEKNEQSCWTDISSKKDGHGQQAQEKTLNVIRQ